MDVDSGLAVRVFGHDPRDQRDLEFPQHVRHAIDRDGEQARITENDLVEALGRGIALVRRPDVRAQHPPDFRQALDKGHGLFVPLFRALGTGLFVAVAVMADGPDDLVGQTVIQHCQFLAQIVAQADRLNAGLVEIARKKDVPGGLDDLEQVLPGGQWNRTDVIETIRSAAGTHS